MKYVTRFLRRLPVRRKLILLTLLTSSVALFFSATIFTIYQLGALRGELVRDVSTLARVVASRSVRPLQQHDGAALDETLRLLMERGHIVSAAIYAPNGRSVAAYGPQPVGLGPPGGDPGARFDFPYLVFSEPVRAGGSTIGTVLLTSDMQGVYQRLLRDGVIGAGMMLASFFLALLLTRRVQGEISTPIQDLAERARRVSRDGDYSPCAVEERDDELGDLLVAFNDLVTGIRERDDALQRSERHFRSLIEHSSDLVFVIGHDETIQYVSPSAERFLDYRPDELAGRTWRVFVHGDDRDAVEEALEGASNAAGESRTVEFRIRHGDGGWSVVEAVVDIRDADDVAGNVLMTVRDIDERKRAELELRRAKETAEAVERAKSRFLANINNEIRTPMTAILAMTELLGRTNLSTEQSRYVEVARNSGDALLHLIDDILELSWLDSGQVALDSLEFDLDAVVEQVLDLFAQRAHGKGLDLCAFVDPAIPRRLRGDPGRLRQVLINLIGNAVKFTDDGEVCLRARSVDGGAAAGEVSIRFTVEDSGIGVPDTLREHLFQPFVQGDESNTRRHGGAGVGLAVSRSLVGLMQGEIDMNTDVVDGASFWFTANFRVVASGQETGPGTAREWRDALALVVEDNGVARGILATQLRGLGLRVEEAEDGTTGLSMLRAAAAAGDPVRLAFVDNGMPGMNGLAMVRAVRADHRLRATRIALMTSLADRAGDGEEGVFVDAQLGKPIKQSGLAETVAVLWAATPPRFDEAVSVPRGHDPRAPVRPALSDTRVLLVEDDEAVRESISLMLTALGYVVDTAVNGAEGVAAAAADVYDAIIMDCQMPQMDGYEATMEIRRRESGRRHVPIIGITGYVLEGARDRCIEAGMDEFLTKPIPMATLAAILESA